MATYIDREKILPNGVFFVNGDDPLRSLDELLNRIWSTPATDVVPVVRCKDCKHRTAYLEEWGETTFYCSRSYAYRQIVNQNDFCSYGERKDGDA